MLHEYIYTKTVEVFEPASTQFNYLQDNDSVRITSKTPLFYYCVHVRFHSNLFTESLLRNEIYNLAVLLLRTCVLRTLPSDGSCLQTLLKEVFYWVRVSFTLGLDLGRAQYYVSSR